MNILPDKHKFCVVALVSAHNEEDVIYHVIGDLVQQGINVYLLNHCSTDATVKVASRWLGKGLIHIENFPQDAGYSKQNESKFIQTEINKRKEELARIIHADWFIHHDADEFREAPFPWMSLLTGIRLADMLGFNAIDFALLNFRPTNNDFRSGEDVRAFLPFFEWGESFNSLQIKAWKNTGKPIDLTTHAGHSVLFEGRRIFPLKFVLRHYPIRSQSHGVRKILFERKSRFTEEERRQGMHVQYDSINEDEDFLRSVNTLLRYRPVQVRGMILARRVVNGIRLGYKEVFKIVFGSK